MTTGTTLNYCAKALKKAKVKKVSVIVFAKTLEKSYRYIKGYNLDK
jgi:hypoxanthine-guanine phosphoribosyltransferase